MQTENPNASSPITAADPETLTQYAIGIEEFRYDLTQSNQAGVEALALFHLQLAIDALSVAATQLKLAGYHQANALERGGRT